MPFYHFGHGGPVGEGRGDGWGHSSGIRGCELSTQGILGSKSWDHSYSFDGLSGSAHVVPQSDGRSNIRSRPRRRHNIE